MHEPTELMQDLASQILDELNLKEKDQLAIADAYSDYMNPDSYKVIKATHYGDPKAQPRARTAGNLNHFYDPGKTFKLFLNEAIRNALGANFKPISSEVYFKARFYRQTPKSFNKQKTVLAELGVLRPTMKPDIDNYEKLLYDALLATLYTDDGVIVHGDNSKFYSCKPRTEVEITFKV